MATPALHWNAATARASALRNWPLIVGFLALALPTFVRLAQEHWTTEQGAHGPLVLATGGWLIWRRLAGSGYRRGTARPWLVAAALVPSLAFYVFGRAYDYLSLEVLGLFGTAIAVGYSLYGASLIRTLWFPLLYLAFVIPIPGWVLDQMTAPLKEIASASTTQILQLFGIPIVREGVTLYVAQYSLLVEDACSGMNAMAGLMALGLFYSYIVHGSSWRYCLVLAVMIIPIAIAANIIRITILVLLTYYAGNEAAQGFLHGLAGMVLFASALLFIFAADSTLAVVVRRWRRAEA